MGHASIFGVSAYFVGYLLTKTEVPMYIAIPVGILASTGAAALFATIAIRTTGVYFLMVTLAEGMIVWGIAYRWSSVTGAENGIRGIHRPEIFEPYWAFYYLVLVVFIVLAFLLYRLINSPFGLTLKGIRESESRMRTLGYDTARHKFIGFTVTGFTAGVGGALYALYNGFVSPSTVEFAKSAEGVLMVIVGGVALVNAGASRYPARMTLDPPREVAPGVVLVDTGYVRPRLAAAYVVRGADSAPFKVTINAANVVSSGVEKAAQGGSVSYEQSVNAQPFFVQGDWDKVEGVAEARGVALAGRLDLYPFCV